MVASVGVRKGVGRIDPAIGICARCGSHALTIGRELAVARIAPNAALQTIAILYGGRPYISETFPSGSGRNGPDVSRNGSY